MDLTLTPTSSSGSHPTTVTPNDMENKLGGSGDRVDIPLENDVLCGRGGSINSVGLLCDDLRTTPVAWFPG